MALKFMAYGGLTTSSDTALGGALYETYIATEGQTLFQLDGSYRPGIHELEVYVNGIRKDVLTDYQEIDSHQVAFNSGLTAGDKVMFIVREVRRSSLHKEFISTEGQTDFIFDIPYHVGLNTLQVYENGMLLRYTDDYLEVDEYTVRLTYSPEAGSKITFKEVM